MRFRNEPAAPDPARQSAGKLANGWAYRLDSGGAQEGDTKEGGAANAGGKRPRDAEDESDDGKGGGPPAKKKKKAKPNKPNKPKKA